MTKQKKRGKRRLGRPPKPPEEKGIGYVQYTYGKDELEAMMDGLARLRKEIGSGVMPLNRQLVIRLCLKRLKRELRDPKFSMVEEYMALN